jgi:dipeptidyl aminopeptidase/acylaminoacyl peptidase
LSGRTVTVLDPNPMVREINLGEASEYRWNDDSGRNFVGALVLPPDYMTGRRYPLVIQTHGFFKNQFISNGGLTSAFAARPLAGVGIVVLQVDDQACTVNYGSTPAEPACAISAYESAVKKLIADGLVDENKIGIIGFSQTCIYVLGALTTPSLQFAAATISDGDTDGYLGFLTTIGHPFGDRVLNQELGRIGAAPVGDGLKKWITESPVFNMDKVSTPLRIEAVGSIGIKVEWEPYAILRYMQKPVDLILIDYGTHPLSNPAERLASQGGNVDWFRFWLEGEEDSDLSKADQYTRWRE